MSYLLPKWLDMEPARQPGAWREMAVEFGRALVLGMAAFLIAYGATRGFTLGRGDTGDVSTVRIVLAKEGGK